MIFLQLLCYGNKMDDELERIKKKRLEEMQRQLLLKQLKEQKSIESDKADETQREPTNREILDKYFGDRSWEVYNAATIQYPQFMPKIEQILIEGIKTGKIREKIDGAALMGFFREIGLSVKLDTKIRISEKGELKTLEQKMKEDFS